MYTVIVTYLSIALVKNKSNFFVKYFLFFKHIFTFYIFIFYALLILVQFQQHEYCKMMI